MRDFISLGKPSCFHFGFEKVQRRIWVKLWRAHRMTKSDNPSFRHKGHISVGEIYADLSTQSADITIGANIALTELDRSGFIKFRKRKIHDLTAKYRGANNEI